MVSNEMHNKFIHKLQYKLINWTPGCSFWASVGVVSCFSREIWQHGLWLSPWLDVMTQNVGVYVYVNVSRCVDDVSDSVLSGPAGYSCDTTSGPAADIFYLK